MRNVDEPRPFLKSKALSRGWVLLLAVALVAAACSTSSTVTASDDEPTTQAEASETVDPSTDSDDLDESTDEPEATAAAEPPAPDPEPTATPDAEQTEEPTPDDGAGEELAAGEASVQVIDAGAEPRVELRFQIAPSCGEISTFTQSQEFSQIADGVPLPGGGIFGTVIETANTATPVGNNFDVRSEIINAQAAPGTDPAGAAALDGELLRLVGVTTIATITDRGVQIPGSSRVEGAEALGELQGLLEGLNQAQSPLPVEAVGLGALWETRSAIEIQGLRVETINQIELISIQGTVLEFRTTGTQEVAEGSMMDLNGTTADVTQWDLSASGTTIVDLATISPISMTSMGEATQGFSAEFDGQQSELVQEIRTEIEMISEPNDGCTGRSTQP